MAKFIEDRLFINTKIRENQEQSLISFSEKLGSAPTFVSYFNRKLYVSTADKHLDNVYQVVGAKSPTRFNRIDNFPIYKIDTMNLDRSYNDFGAESDISLTGEILPGTITPYPDDVLFLEYNHAAQNKDLMVFRVTNVTESLVDSRKYYKINFEPYDKPVSWVEEQVDEQLVFDCSDYENNRTPILPLALYQDLYNCRAVRARLTERYLQFFYDKDSSTLSFAPNFPRERDRMTHYIAQYLAERYGIFSFDRKFLRTAVHFSYPFMEEENFRIYVDYENTPFAVFTHELQAKNLQTAFMPLLATGEGKGRQSIYDVWPGRFFILTPWPATSGNKATYDFTSLPFFREHMEAGVEYSYYVEPEPDPPVDPDLLVEPEDPLIEPPVPSDPLAPLTDRSLDFWLENILITVYRDRKIPQAQYRSIIETADERGVERSIEDFIKIPAVMGALKLIEEQIAPVISKPKTYERTY